MRKLTDLTKNIFLSNFKRLSRPYKLTFALTYQCNSRCKICQIWKKEKTPELSLSQLEKFFNSNDFFNWIDLTGGEVFLRKDLLEVIKIILQTQKHLYFLHLPTNAILTKKIISQIQAILRLKPNRLVISIALDGPEKVHDRLRGVKNNWQQAVKTYKALKSLKSKRFDCFFGMTLSKHNFRLIEATYQALKKEVPGLSRHDLHFNLAHHSSHYYQNQAVDLGLNKAISKSLKQFNEKKKLRVSTINWLENIYQRLIPKYLTSFKTPVACQALSASVFLSPQGNLYPCAMWSNKLGNLKDYNYHLGQFWQDSKTTASLKLIKNKQCPNCWTPCEAYQSILSSLAKAVLV